MHRLLIEQAEESLLVRVDHVKVGAVVEQRLDDGGLGRLVEGGGVKRRVAVAVLGIGVSAALQEKADGGHGGEDADGVAADGGGVPGTGQVEGGAPAAAQGTNAHKLEHSRLDFKHLQEGC